VLLGSSQTMMNSLFLNSTSPLYERADLILHLNPMGYRHFCEALEIDPLDAESFYIFSLVGGVPRYWSYIRKGDSPIQVAEHLYSISDFALSFWYRSYSPHRSRWYLYDEEKKNKIIRDHAALVLEECFRGKFGDAARYWEGQELEFDCVRHAPKEGHIVIFEIKLRELSHEEMESIEGDILQKFLKSKLAAKYQFDRIEVLGGPQALAKIADQRDLMHTK
jgi:hypothetical protein